MAEWKERRSRFSSRSQAICQANSSTKVIFTTSAGPTLTGIPGNFSQARLPPTDVPSGVIRSKIKPTLKASTHFHFFIRISRSTMENPIYTQIPSSSATV